MTKIFGYTLTVLLALVAIVLVLGIFLFPSVSVNRMNIATASYTVTFQDGSVETGDFDPVVRVANQSDAGQCAEPYEGSFRFAHRVQEPLISFEARTQSLGEPLPSLVSVVLGTGPQTRRFGSRGEPRADSTLEITRGPLRWHYSGQITQNIATLNDAIQGEMTVTFEGVAQATYTTPGQISLPNFCWGRNR